MLMLLTLLILSYKTSKALAALQVSILGKKKATTTMHPLLTLHQLLMLHLLTSKAFAALDVIIL